MSGPGLILQLKACEQRLLEADTKRNIVGNDRGRIKPWNIDAVESERPLLQPLVSGDELKARQEGSLRLSCHGLGPRGSRPRKVNRTAVLSPQGDSLRQRQPGFLLR